MAKRRKQYPLLKKKRLDSDEFYVPGRDNKGDKSRIWCWIMPGHKSQIHQFVISPDFPYTCEADFIRHAIRRQLDWLDSLNPPIRSIMGQNRVIEQLTRDQEYQIHFEETFKQVADVVSKLMIGGHLDQARKYLSGIASAIRGMPSGTWKKQYVEQFKSSFGDYLKTTKQRGLIRQLETQTKGYGGDNE